MKTILKTTVLLAMALSAICCAKAVKEGPNDAEERYFNAWMKVNHPDLSPVGSGIYILDEEAGNGAEINKDSYVYASYTVTDLEGNITTYTEKETAEQIGKYVPSDYYGPKVITTFENTLPTGLKEAIIGMKVGGKKKIIIPSWLMTYKTYDTPEEYLENESSGTSCIYDIKITDVALDISKHEIRQMSQYFVDNGDIFGRDFTSADSLKGHYGCYYRQLQAPVDTTSFPKDTTIYINYTGKLLNGQVFDTTIEKVAKDNNIYSASRTYEPTSIKWAEKYEDLTMGSSNSSMINGFALTLWQMRSMEKGVGVFYSPMGYSDNGSGSSIPPYSPLVFEIEIVAKPEN
jgi:FKBP-type peptidyl-prolyl cis-trans isomerase FklB